MKRKTPHPKKAEIVEKVTGKLNKARAFFLTDYKGLTHKQLEDLRKSLKKVEADLLVVKNTLFKISLDKTEKTTKENKEKLYESLKDSNAAFFAYGDPLAAVKELFNFSKSFYLPKVRIGVLENKLTTSADFDKLAILPSKDILLATLFAGLKSPIYGLHNSLNWNLQKIVIVLNNIKNKKPD